MEPVTPRKMDILRFLRDYGRKNGYSPTMQEIADHLQLSKVTVFEHIGALERKGLILRGDKHKARSLQLADSVEFPDEARSTQIPLAGRIAAGVPLEALEDTEKIDLESIFSSDEPTFCLQVVGNSMIDDGIHSGDLVVCERRETARNGQTVVALLDNGEATLKRFYKERGRIRLQPANPAFEPIYLDSVRIQGIVIGLIRKM
jgi:repressor LexA